MFPGLVLELGWSIHLKVSALSVALVLGWSSLTPVGFAETGFDPAGNGDDHHEIIDRYVTATQTQKASGIQMDAEVEASLPKLQKKGSLQAIRVISKLGKITWDHLQFFGDNTIKKEVIARFIQTEQDQTDTSKMAITNDNYKFKYRGLENRYGQRVYVFHLTPKKKSDKLFKGELWLDAETCQPVHEAGTFVKSPSIFLKKVQFARDYEVVNGIAVPKHVESQAETRFWGLATVTIRYNNIVKSDQDQPSPAFPEQQ